MLRRSRFERLTYVQMQQKLIHLESELSYFRTNHEGVVQKYNEQLKQMKQDNDLLKRDVQNLKKENETLLLNDYNPKLIAKLDREKSAKHIKELAILEDEIKSLKNQLSDLRQEKEINQQLLLRVEQMQEDLNSLTISLSAAEGEKEQIHEDLIKLNGNYNKLQILLDEQKKNAEKAKIRENLLVSQLSKISDENNQVLKHNETAEKEKQNLEAELADKTSELDKLIKEKNQLITHN
ncbi:coiled-coil domain-containing protein, partial [Cytobacillus oceanisediminis]